MKLDFKFSMSKCGTTVNNCEDVLLKSVTSSVINAVVRSSIKEQKAFGVEDMTQFKRDFF